MTLIGAMGCPSPVAPPPTRDPSALDMPGETQSSHPETIGRYRISHVIGEGAMGAVYAGWDEVLGRDVAIKTIRTVRGEGIESWQAYRDRFMHETRALGALSHPNIVHVFDVVLQDEVPYLVMERLDGPSLESRIEDGTLTDAEVRDIGAQIAKALEAAHERGILHRDIKPANVLEAAPGCWKLVDFGIARLPGSSLTAAGQFLGTPSYAAPESLLAGRFSPATDVYGLGATLYAALVGSPPHGEQDVASVVRSVVEGAHVSAPRQIRPGISRGLDATVMAALGQDPERRPTPGAVHDALLARGSLARRFLGNSSGRARVVRAGVGGALLLLCAFGAWAGTGAEAELSGKMSLGPSAASLKLPKAKAGVAAQPDLPMRSHPWHSSDVPPELAEIDTRLRAGWQPDRTTDRRIIRYARRHGNDPRPSLLLARIYLERGWRADAITQYERAYAIDRAARRDSRMQEDLVALSADRRHGARARAVLARIYGESTPSVRGRTKGSLASSSGSGAGSGAAVGVGSGSGAGSGAG